MRIEYSLTLLATIAAATSIARDSQAEPVLRHQVDQRGDFVLFGNTIGYECHTDPAVPEPVVGTANCDGLSGFRIADSSPDLFWRADAPGEGRAWAFPLLSGSPRHTAAT